MGMGLAPTWLRQVSPPPASQNHFNDCSNAPLKLQQLQLMTRHCQA